MDIVETPVIEELVNREGHRVANAHDGTERTGTSAQMGNLAKEFQRMFLGLKRVLLRIAVTEDFQFRNFDLDGLALSRRRYKIPFDGHTCTGGDPLQYVLGRRIEVDHGLQVPDGGAIIDGDKLVVAECTYPPLHEHLTVVGGHGKKFPDPGSFHSEMSHKEVRKKRKKQGIFIAGEEVVRKLSL